MSRTSTHQRCKRDEDDEADDDVPVAHQLDNAKKAKHQGRHNSKRLSARPASRHTARHASTSDQVLNGSLFTIYSAMTAFVRTPYVVQDNSPVHNSEVAAAA
ncbi:hypothetical protein OC835_007463, partial [Tilletia horrida]